MPTVKLIWDGIFDASRIDEYEGLNYTMGVYMILDSIHNRASGRWGSHRLMYIGQVYDQTFQERLNQHVRGDDVWRWIRRNVRHQPTFKIGHIDLQDGNRISRELVDDIEGLLINVLQPPGNLQGISSYSGRALVILNQRRYTPLPPRISTEDIH